MKDLIITPYAALLPVPTRYDDLQGCACPTEPTDSPASQRFVLASPTPNSTRWWCHPLSCPSDIIRLDEDMLSRFYIHRDPEWKRKDEFWFQCNWLFNALDWTFVMAAVTSTSGQLLFSSHWLHCNRFARITRYCSMSVLALLHWLAFILRYCSKSVLTLLGWLAFILRYCSKSVLALLRWLAFITTVNRQSQALS